MKNKRTKMKHQKLHSLSFPVIFKKITKNVEKLKIYNSREDEIYIFFIGENN